MVHLIPVALFEQLRIFSQYYRIDMSRLTELQIDVAPTDTTAISFALLQGHLKELLGTTEQVTAFKMDLVLSQLYTQYYNMQTEVLQGGLQTKNALLECSEVMQSCKDDREEVFKLSEDRLRLVKELKEATDQSFQLLQENQKLKTMLCAYEELNTLLNTRHAQMEQQLNKLAKSEGVKDSVKLLQTEYNSILADNLAIQKEMDELGLQASKLKEFALPIRVINIAFTCNRSLRELVMRQAEQELGANKQLRDLFMSFSFDLGDK